MNKARQKIYDLCISRNFSTENYKNRLKEEFREIENQGEWEYFLDLYNQKVKYPNENNLLIPYLLGIVDEFDINKPPVTFVGDYPDIDVDFIKPVRDYIKNEWTPKTFGREFVCSIGNYTTFGIKSTFLDMARLFGKDRDEIISLTTKLGLKDEDGNKLTLDKALEEYPDLAKYCEQNPDVYAGVKKLLHRNRGMGVHAGGVIISRQRIDELVPLVTDKNGAPVSAWSEGQTTSDLSPMGLVKYDQLVIANLMQIAVCLKLVKERHNLPYICSDPVVNRDWSDTSYLNDEKSIAMANAGDLLGIFQFDSPGIRELCKGNVDSFNDMMAFNSLYRPSTLNVNAHKIYVNRKHGREKYDDLHPILAEILKNTYNLMIYQEDVMRVFHVVGKIPMRDCYALIKAISKKKLDKFKKYEEMFLENGKQTLGYSDERIRALWETIQSWAGYGFTKSHACAYTYLAMRSLYLKSHYPIEFFTATLRCESHMEKIKEYINDARNRGIRIEPIRLNQSKENFEIGFYNDKEVIYYGFSKLKGLGDEVAERIVANQPYSSFEDFLQRFGTDLRVLTPLILLCAFGEHRVGQFKFYEHYRDWLKRGTDRDKRAELSLEKFRGKLQELLPAEVEADFSSEHLAMYKEMFDIGKFKVIEKLWHSCHTTINSYAKKKENHVIPHYVDFDPDEFGDNFRGDKLLDCPPEDAEKAFYGFRWTHPVERSPDHSFEKRKTFFNHRMYADGGKSINHVEVVIEKVSAKPTKKGGVYYSLNVSDMMDEHATVVVWEEDYKIFQKELVEGNLVNLLLDAPDSGYHTYKLNSPPLWERRKIPAFPCANTAHFADVMALDKTMDFRVVELEKGSYVPPVKVQKSDEDDVPVVLIF